MFKPPGTAPPLPPMRDRPLPEGKETVTLRIDRSILEFFQGEGPGWQERIVEALRQVAGQGASQSLPIDKLNASNDE
jgi:uncharacterized protein (DUF4415 family)